MDSFRILFWKRIAGHHRNSNIPHKAHGRPFCYSCRKPAGGHFVILAVSPRAAILSFLPYTINYTRVRQSRVQTTVITHTPILVPARSKACAGIADSNPAGEIDVCLFVVCWQVEVSVSDWSLVQRSPTECVSECDPEALIGRMSWPARSWCAIEKTIYIYIYIYHSRNGGCLDQNILTY
jgi:hypothetical protein